MTTGKPVQFFIRMLRLAAVLSLIGSADTFAAGLCLPRNSSESSRWPVCAIYMHGLFGAAPYNETLFEIPYRARLEHVANEKHCRIAVPIGDRHKYHDWNGLGITEVMRRAHEACAGALFIDRPDLIGFSNGANTLRKQTCESLSQFNHVTLVGPTGASGNDRIRSCGNVGIHQIHEVLSEDGIRSAITFAPRNGNSSGGSGATH